MQLAGATVLVTGATRGIGRATAVLLADRGAIVVVSGRDEAALAELAAEVGGTAVVADLGLVGAADHVVQEALSRHGRLDGLVANAGVGHVGDVAQMSSAQLTEVIDLNVRAPLDLARAAIAPLSAQAAVRPGGAGIVFVSSIAGAVGVPGESVYSASKAALEAFAPLLAEEVRGLGISVGTVLPGVVDTDFLRRRQVPYTRRFPRPMPADRVARVIVTFLEDGRARRIEPRWLAVPARLSATAPGIYRRLARRFG